MHLLGLYPRTAYYLLALLVPILLWALTYKSCKRRHLRIIHTSMLVVSYWEELLFRGLIFGAALHIWHTLWPALIISSALFGIFHLRNLWWSSRKQVLVNCLYAGLIFGILTGFVRWWTGSIYLCIAVHAINNFSIIAIPARVKDEPNDSFLLSKQGNMNWFEYIFSGFWVRKLLAPSNT